MNKIDRLATPGNVTALESDYARWCAEQGALLRAGRFDALDSENIAVEIESLGRSDRREIENRLKVLLTHLLKYRYQAEQRSSGWRGTIRDQRRQISKLLRESPSLALVPAEALAEEYGFARSDAIEETGLSEATFPAVCPFTVDQILDHEFLPG